MANDMVKKRVGIALAAVGGVLVGMVATGYWRGTPWETEQKARAGGDHRVGFQLWMELTRRDIPVQSRRATAGQLARFPEGQPWVVLLLYDPWALYPPEDADRLAGLPQETLEEMRSFDAAIIAALIEALPTNADPSVLWGLTSRLSDTHKGRYSEERGSGLSKRRLECESAPLRDLARQALSRCLQVDCEYDVVKWRKALLFAAGHRNGLPTRGVETGIAPSNLRERR